MRKPISETERRKRRRRRRIQVVIIYTALAVALAWFLESQATTTVIFVRHAEKAAQPADDPGLSEAGQRCPPRVGLSADPLLVLDADDVVRF